MAERAGMTALIDLVERRVADPANAAHSREDIQRALDVYRIETRYGVLTPVPSWLAGGTAAYHTFDAGLPYWESDGVLVDAGYNVVAPATADWLGGRWTFVAQPTRPVMLVGWNHDPYQAAADLLEVRAAQLAEQYDFSTGPDSYRRSQRHKQLLDMAARYRAQSPRLKAKAEAVVTDWAMPGVVFDVFTI